MNEHSRQRNADLKSRHQVKDGFSLLKIVNLPDLGVSK